MREVPLTRGAVALVDDEDFERVNKLKWQLATNGYAMKSIRVKSTPDSRTKDALVSVYMHRFILNAPADLDVDHLDGNKINNQRHNIQLCTARENAVNWKRSNITNYRGVYENKSRFGAKLWLPGGPGVYVGTYDSPEEAAIAYDIVALTVFGPGHKGFNFSLSDIYTAKINPPKYFNTYTQKIKLKIGMEI